MGEQDVFSLDRYMIRRKVFRLFGAAFHVFDEAGAVVLFSKLKAFKLKEDIRLYTGEDMQTELLVIKARNIIDLAATYDVVDARTGEKVGALRRKGLKSMIKDEWLFLGPADEEKGMIQEDNIALALLRRLITADWIPQSFEGSLGGQKVCMFRQKFNPFIFKLDLDFSMDTGKQLDRRLGLAAAVLLCAIEGRQG